MKQIKSTAIIGAGALGLLYMPSLNKELGDNCFFLTGEKRYSNLKNKSFHINGKKQKYPVKRAKDLTGHPDLLLIAVKNHHLDDIAPLLEQVAGPQTIIVSVLNGIESEEFLKRHCPDSKILYCAVLGMDAVKEGDSLTFTTQGKFLVGSENNDLADPELAAFTDLLNRSDLTYIVPKDIHRELWYKWMINIGVNQVSAVTGATYGTFQTEQEVYDLMKVAMGETIRVAHSLNIDLREDDFTTWDKILHTLGKSGKTSMLQDMEAGRKTEVESFAGKLMEKAREKGIAVPVNETLFRIIRTREKLYLGQD